MLKFSLGLLMTTILLILPLNQEVEATTGNTLNKQAVQELLEQANEVQFTLTEHHHSWEEAANKLSAYMTAQFANEFMQEHLVLEEKGYIFYGTDFSIYIVPHYSFNDDTKMVMDMNSQKIYVSEKFKGTGPVFFDSQYEIVTLEQDKTGWKIAAISFLNELPNHIEEGEKLEEVTEQQRVSHINTEDNPKTAFQSGIYHTSIDGTLVNLGVTFNQPPHAYGPNKSKSMTMSRFIGGNLYGSLYQTLPITTEVVKQEYSLLTLLSILWNK
ncbi:DUF3993 domain-containing protein [Bacillus sp. DJP31]|uniref:DUF3993 domain-containing protein n=1 Tax=Bacillus sp. DJP31 TaxID=3409789 RepID=UPI003BB77069